MGPIAKGASWARHFFRQPMSRSKEAPMNILPETDVLATENLADVYEDLKKAVVQAVRQNQPVHETEKAIWEQLLRLGRQALAQVFKLLGNGDLGDSVTLPDGRC